MADYSGVWAAIQTPFDANDRFDVAVFRENAQRLAGAGVDGVYTTDSDGEFYALEFDEFQAVVDALAAEGSRLGIQVLVGATWSHTAGVIARLQYAAGRGIGGAHVGHPTYMDMSPASLRQFWQDVSHAVPRDFHLVHYNTRRIPNYLTAADYAELAGSIPNLIGTKQVTADISEFMSFVDSVPSMSHFTIDQTLTPFMLVGARGVNSWLATFNAPFVVAWYQECLSGDWAGALHRQRLVNHFVTLRREILGPFGSHGVLNKAVAAASSFLIPSVGTRRPYLPIPESAVRQFRSRVEAELPELVWTP
jgi:4-hydroxy-tetrahydrodipicolinate synthase